MDTIPRPTPRSLIENLLVLLLLLALLLALYDVLQTFFGILTFAIIFALSFAAPFERLCTLLKNKRTLAAILYSLLLISIVALPFIYLLSAMSEHTKDVIHWIAYVKENGVPDLPAWIASVPFLGNEISSFWQKLQANPKEVFGAYESHLVKIAERILSSGAGMLGVALEFITGIIISAVFLVSGDKLLGPVRSTVSHMFGEKDGNDLLRVTGQAVKGVSVGVMGTAFIAAIISFIGFAIAGIPFPLGFAALVFFMVLIQVGPAVVWLPLIIWVGMQGHTGWTIFMIVYFVVLLVAESVLKPLLIAKSGKMPFLILFLGVIGGMVAWGFTGMFKGAIILAVSYTIFNSWLEKKEAKD
ncbi:MAG: AI-2E family transporter [Cyclobacteriaceae bacterium]|nr:AI-2E family transporter [Cyclobacteriaceae bacterium]